MNLPNNHLKKQNQLLKSQSLRLPPRSQFNLNLTLNHLRKLSQLPRRLLKLPPSLNNHQARVRKSLPPRKQLALSLLLLLSQLLKSNLSQSPKWLTKMTKKEFSKFALEDSLSKLMIVISETSSVNAETLLRLNS